MEEKQATKISKSKANNRFALTRIKEKCQTYFIRSSPSERTKPDNSILFHVFNLPVKYAKMHIKEEQLMFLLLSSRRDVKKTKATEKQKTGLFMLLSSFQERKKINSKTMALCL